MSFDSYEANGYMHDFDLLIISHKLRVSNPTRSGCKEESIQIAHVYLKALENKQVRCVGLQCGHSS